MAPLDGRIALTTERLVLRNLAPGDLGPMAAMNGDPAVMTWLGGPMSAERSDLLAHDIAAGFAEDGIGKIAVERRADGAFLGLCGLSHESWYPDDLELGWRLLPAYWGHGYATEAAAAWRDFAFDELGLKRFISIADAPNARSIAVMRRIGMRFDHQATLEDDGIPFDAVIYAMERPAT